MSNALIEIPAKLPTDIDESNRLFVQAAQWHNELKLEYLEQKNQFDQLKKYLYAPRREKFIPSTPEQLFLGDTAEEQEAKEVRKRRIESYERGEKSPNEKKSHPGRLALPSDVPRNRIVIEPTEGERNCCGESKKMIGEEITEELEYNPGSHFVNCYVRPKYACPKCEKGVSIAALAPRPIEGGRPGAGLLSHVIVSKYGDHLPLYRQEQISLRSGIKISRQTMMGWVKFCYDFLLPVYHAMVRQVKASGVINSDDSPFKVLDRENKNGSRLGFMWVYVGDYSQVVFDYRPGRGRAGPEEFLKGAKGYLQSDGYGAYNHLEGLERVACMMHIRRYFYQAIDTDKNIASYVLAQIARIYDVERKAKELSLSGKTRLEYRKEHSLDILGQLFLYVRDLKTKVLPKSPIGKAVTYALGQWPWMISPFQTNGDLEIDNGVSERAIRRLAIGRKNWMFAGSDEGAKWMAVMYSLIGSCKALGMEPFTYLKWLIETMTKAEDEIFENLTPLSCSKKGLFLLKTA
jgi:transposase